MGAHTEGFDGDSGVGVGPTPAVGKWFSSFVLKFIVGVLLTLVVWLRLSVPALDEQQGEPVVELFELDVI